MSEYDIREDVEDKKRTEKKCNANEIGMVTLQCNKTQQYTVLHYTALHYTVLHCTTLRHCFTLYMSLSLSALTLAARAVFSLSSASALSFLSHSSSLVSSSDSLW